MLLLRGLLFISLFVGIVGCGDDDPPTAPTPPVSRPTVTETFSGTLTVNGGVTHSFNTGSGQIIATLDALAPNNAAVIGVALGTWNGAACQIVIANDSAGQAVQVVGVATTTGSFCMRVYDVGQLAAATDYTVTVVHF
jgi:hypothetical protein